MSDIQRAIWNPSLTQQESLSAFLKDISNILDFMERLKNEEYQNFVNVADHTEGLKFVLAFIYTFTQLSYFDLEQFENTMSASRQVVENLLRQILNDADNNLQYKFNIHHVLSSLRGNISDCISSCHRSKLSGTMNDEQLNFLLLNLHYISKILAEQFFPLVTQYEILQNGCGNMRDLHGLVVNGYIEQDIVKYVLPQFPLMDEKVGLFLWDDRFKIGSRLFKLTHLLLKIIPIELGVMHIYFTNLKASTTAEVACFIKQHLEISLGILREYLIHLQEHLVTFIIRSNSGARNIHVMIEFLLIILTDVPKDIIDHDKLFDLSAHVGSLTREVSTLVHDIEEKSQSKESTKGTNRATLDLLKNIEHLKEDLKYVYLKDPNPCQWCFPMSDGPLFMRLLHIHLNDLLDFNAYSISLIKDKIEFVKEDLEFIRLFFMNVDKRLYKDLWARVLHAAYGEKDVIDSIIVRDNGLLHLIFSVPITIRKINRIKEKFSNLPKKSPKNKSLIVVNCPKKPVESKSLTVGKIVVGFEEETQSIISKLTNIVKDPDVISIIVGQEYNKRNLLEKVYDQVTFPDSKLSENIDVADEIRRQVIGKSEVDVMKVIDSEVMKVIELSYDHLPCHLKPCLLYLARFPKDTTMETDVLKMYWHAEGHVEQTEMMSAEEVMEV
ncbi:hypothetical protein CQW23_12546 [Capsicum baccatum]|uniref:Rx N-terminal domain-containing protein n=1 Tax=Capsicum baccatum TaxID=33114 RepID=A0A2G2WSU5_CAPBA|nr:hypothetical protein CQW23_12546 [Capsicum baccatum]